MRRAAVTTPVEDLQGPVPLRLARLISEHASYRRVAREAGIGATTIHQIAHGDYAATREQEQAIGAALTVLGIDPTGMWMPDWRARWMREPIMLSDEALKHFKLDRDPWVNELEDESDLFLDASRKDIRGRLLRGVARQHFIALIGPVGSGKSTLLDNCRYWMRRQERYDVVEPANIDRGILSVQDLVQAIIQTLSPDAPKNSREARHRQARRVLVESRMKDRYPVIVIDEAQSVPTPTLRALKVLYDHKEPALGYRRLVSIVLAGQSDVAVVGENVRDLGAKLRSPSLEEVAARVYVIRVKALEEAILAEYVAWKLHRAGASNGLVSDEALQRLARLHINTPARIARAMPATMQLAYEVGDKRLTAEHVERAVLGGP